MLRAVDQYTVAGPVAAAGTADLQGIQYADEFVARVNQVCPIIDEKCVRANGDFVVTQYLAYVGLCNDDRTCDTAFFARIDDVMGEDMGDLFVELDIESTPPTSPTPTENDGVQFARTFVNDLKQMCHPQPVTIDCLNRQKEDVSAKVQAYAAQCRSVPVCDNLFTRELYTGLGSSVAERINEINEEVSNAGAGAT